MATEKWQLKGEFYGNCSCSVLQCPCPTSNFMAMPTNGWCRLAIIFAIDRGFLGDVNLDGLRVIMVADIPGVMRNGNWAIGLIVQQGASPEQAQAIGAILGGQVGGPMAEFAPYVTKFLGMEFRPIEFRLDGNQRALAVPGMLNLSAEGMLGADKKEPVYWDNVPHPASSRVAIARGQQTHIHAFGVDFDGPDGGSTGVYSPFNWQVG
jgi:hypothetical protein